MFAKIVIAIISLYMQVINTADRRRSARLQAAGTGDRDNTPGGAGNRIVDTPRRRETAAQRREREEQERREREQREREEQERREREQREREEQERREREEQERREREQREREEQERRERQEQERERERLERVAAAEERLEQERLERERLEQERLDRERLEQERLERERLERERLEQERLGRERQQLDVAAEVERQREEERQRQQAAAEEERQRQEAATEERRQRAAAAAAAAELRLATTHQEGDLTPGPDIEEGLGEEIVGEELGDEIIGEELGDVVVGEELGDVVVGDVVVGDEIVGVEGTEARTQVDDEEIERQLTAEAERELDAEEPHRYDYSGEGTSTATRPPTSKTQQDYLNEFDNFTEEEKARTMANANSLKASLLQRLNNKLLEVTANISSLTAQANDENGIIERLSQEIAGLESAIAGLKKKKQTKGVKNQVRNKETARKRNQEQKDLRIQSLNSIESNILQLRNSNDNLVQRAQELESAGQDQIICIYLSKKEYFIRKHAEEEAEKQLQEAARQLQEAELEAQLNIVRQTHLQIKQKKKNIEKLKKELKDENIQPEIADRLFEEIAQLECEVSRLISAVHVDDLEREPEEIERCLLEIRNINVALLQLPDGDESIISEKNKRAALYMKMEDLRRRMDLDRLIGELDSLNAILPTLTEGDEQIEQINLQIQQITLNIEHLQLQSYDILSPLDMQEAVLELNETREKLKEASDSLTRIKSDLAAPGEEEITEAEATEKEKEVKLKLLQIQLSIAKSNVNLSKGHLYSAIDVCISILQDILLRKEALAISTQQMALYEAVNLEGIRTALNASQNERLDVEADESLQPEFKRVRLEQIQAAINDLSQILDFYNTEIPILQQNITTLREGLEQDDAQFANAKEAYTELKNKVKEKVDEVKAINAEIKNVIGVKPDEEELVKRQMQKRITDIEKAIKQRTIQADSLKESLQSNKTELEILTAQKESFMEHLACDDLEIANLVVLEQAQTATPEQLQQLQSLRERVHQTQAQINNTVAEITMKQQEIERLEHEIFVCDEYITESEDALFNLKMNYDVLLKIRTSQQIEELLKQRVIRRDFENKDKMAQECVKELQNLDKLVDDNQASLVHLKSEFQASIANLPSISADLHTVSQLPLSDATRAPRMQELGSAIESLVTGYNQKLGFWQVGLNKLNELKKRHLNLRQNLSRLVFQRENVLSEYQRLVQEDFDYEREITKLNENRVLEVALEEAKQNVVSCEYDYDIFQNRTFGLQIDLLLTRFNAIKEVDPQRKAALEEQIAVQEQSLVDLETEMRIFFDQSQALFLTYDVASRRFYQAKGYDVSSLEQIISVETQISQKRDQIRLQQESYNLHQVSLQMSATTITQQTSDINVTEGLLQEYTTERSDILGLPDDDPNKARRLSDIDEAISLAQIQLDGQKAELETVKDRHSGIKATIETIQESIESSKQEKLVLEGQLVLLRNNVKVLEKDISEIQSTQLRLLSARDLLIVKSLDVLASSREFTKLSKEYEDKMKETQDLILELQTTSLTDKAALDSLVKKIKVLTDELALLSAPKPPTPTPTPPKAEEKEEVSSLTFWIVGIALFLIVIGLVFLIYLKRKALFGGKND
ncbi:Chromosome partition protein Smc [Nucleospora cyclopteri]